MKNNAIFFDLDGVLIYECGATDFGYAFLFNMLLERGFDVDARLADLCIDKRFFEMVPEIRPEIKGTHFLSKIFKLFDILAVDCDARTRYSPEEYVHYELTAQRYYIARNCPPEKYIIEEGIELLQLLRQYDNIHFSTLTANEESQAEWLLDYINVKFDTILGFRYDAPEIGDKIQLLRGHLDKNSFERVVVIGDGPMDIRAGKAVGAFTVGIAWDAAARNSLEEVQCDYICDGVDANAIFSVLQCKLNLV